MLDVLGYKHQTVGCSSVFYVISTLGHLALCWGRLAMFGYYENDSETVMRILPLASSAAYFRRVIEAFGAHESEDKSNLWDANMARNMRRF